MTTRTFRRLHALLNRAMLTIAHPDRPPALLRIDPEQAAKALPADGPEIWAPAQRYPAAVGVFCDDCGDVFEGDFIVSDDMDQAARFEAARTHLRTSEGWSCTPAGDFCPRCAVSLRLRAEQASERADRADRAEAVLARVRKLGEVWADAPDPLARAMADDLGSALDGTQQPTTDTSTSQGACQEGHR